MSSLCLIIKHRAMKAYGRGLDLGIRWREWSASCFVRFTPWEYSPQCLWTEGWLGPKAGPDLTEMRRIMPQSRIKPRQSRPYPVAIPAVLLWPQFWKQNKITVDVRNWKLWRVWISARSAYVKYIVALISCRVFMEPVDVDWSVAIRVYATGLVLDLASWVEWGEVGKELAGLCMQLHCENEERRGSVI
jgi:hypothetical protein